MVTAITLVLVILGLSLGWRRLGAIQRDKMRRQLVTNARTLAALLGVLALPATLLLPMPNVIPAWLVKIGGLSLWGLFLVAYWDDTVMPPDKQALATIPPGSTSTFGNDWQTV